VTLSLKPFTERSRYRLMTLMMLAFLSMQCRPSTPHVHQLQVYAASSMKEVLQEAKQNFEAQHPTTTIALNYAGSQILRLQIEQGAPADIFISANNEHMQALKDTGHVQHIQQLAHNELIIITPTHNPSQVQQLADLSNARRIVIGTKQSPIGMYTREMLHKASQKWTNDFEKRVLNNVVSQETNVRLIRAKVALGEADAALVYRTDASGVPNLKAISIPKQLNIKAAYGMALTTRSSQKAVSQTFFNYFKSPKGLALLARHGFVVK
jgi:molybdate transport system substrate-binding protein